MELGASDGQQDGCCPGSDSVSRRQSWDLPGAYRFARPVHLEFNAYLSFPPQLNIIEATLQVDVIKMGLGLPCGPVGKNSPANAGDTDSIPGPGGSHMQQSS